MRYGVYARTKPACLKTLLTRNPKVHFFTSSPSLRFLFRGERLPFLMSFVVRTAVYNLRHILTEVCFYVATQTNTAAGVGVAALFDRVVQRSRNGLVLRASRNGEQMIRVSSSMFRFGSTSCLGSFQAWRNAMLREWCLCTFRNR